MVAKLSPLLRATPAASYRTSTRSTD